MMPKRVSRTKKAQYTVTERLDTGQIRWTSLDTSNKNLSKTNKQSGHVTHIAGLLKKVFLPVGYPNSVSPDYLRYQILNALQAFCNSLASLLSSRATLEGFGVGDPSATATHALLLTVLQDVFSRLTTILGAYWLGSALVPEAKTYRLLADVFNDAAVIVDTLIPLLISLSFPFRIPGVRAAALCLSASFRALCSIAAGGSKTAITLHFATPLHGSGNVGDLNAKDSSKETVLALLGMLLGTFVVPHLTDPRSTYMALFVFIALHLSINYLGVRGLVLRSLNRQRLAILWSSYRASENPQKPVILTPSKVSGLENIFRMPNSVTDGRTRKTLGYCRLGTSFADLSSGYIVPSALLELFEEERYLLWYDHRCLRRSTGGRGYRVENPLRLCVTFKEGYAAIDQAQAWTHAVELCRLAALHHRKVMILGHGEDEGADDDNEALALVRASYRQMKATFTSFMRDLVTVGWVTSDVALMTSPPKAVLLAIGQESVDGLQSANDPGQEDKKIR